MSFGSKLYELRRNKNMTQENVADVLGVTRQSVSRWESDMVYPDLDKIVRLSNLLDVSCDYLLKDNYHEIAKSIQPSKILLDLIGKDVYLGFYEDVEEPGLYNINNKCIVKEIDGSIMKLELSVYRKKKWEVVKEILIPINTIKNITIKEKK